MSTITIVDGFSLTNRWLLYASFMLAPAQFYSGLGNNCPSNIGFLAYNWYTQIIWLRAIRAHELHALSLLPVHFNLLFVFTYLGGVTSGNLYMGIFLGLGTAGVIILNTVAAWTSWATNQPEGLAQIYPRLANLRLDVCSKLCLSGLIPAHRHVQVYEGEDGQGAVVLWEVPVDPRWGGGGSINWLATDSMDGAYCGEK
ncbi:hypothetical protein V494_00954 [Pseudogymnoascus sp. VKM F-4513 (FW-928)]|nr:hypothetical protein V494_00954 [Pseudogymnoascus sp. VKM F-4513 (FW-928)]